MHEAIKTRWVNALRSGKYQQGQTFLHSVSQNTYCCLGVLCDLAVKDGVITKAVEPLLSGKTVMSFSDETQFLPVAVSEWAGLSPSGTPTVEVVNNDHEANSYTLIDLNDDLNVGFDRIADLIEAQL